MARPKRFRKICEEPYFSKFSPEGEAPRGVVEMSVDEYEVIRLVDFLKKTHDECARQMDISRTTVTEIYDCARQKIADVIVNGRALVISGGCFRICEGNVYACAKCKYQAIQKNQNEIMQKGDSFMRIAVTYENEMIFQHFGHTEKFKIYDVENGEIITKTIVSTNGQGHGALSAILGNYKVDVLICGGIGGGAQMALSEFGIRLYGGVSGNCDDAVNAFLKNELDFNPNVKCSHHEHEHGGEAHTCGEHGCGKGNCH